MATGTKTANVVRVMGCSVAVFRIDMFVFVNASPTNDATEFGAFTDFSLHRVGDVPRKAVFVYH
jgi:hypothetical protein